MDKPKLTPQEATARAKERGRDYASHRAYADPDVLFVRSCQDDPMFWAAIFPPYSPEPGPGCAGPLTRDNARWAFSEGVIEARVRGTPCAAQPPSSDEPLKRADELVEQATSILFNRPCRRVATGAAVKKQSETCLSAEDVRIRALVGKRNSPAFLRRDPDRMCEECAAYEHLLRAHALLVELAKNERGES